MDQTKAVHDPNAGPFNVVYIGAGDIMFGSAAGPWNHSFRIEHKLGPRLKVVAIIDPNLDRIAAMLKNKCESFVESAYRDTGAYKTIEEFAEKMKPEEKPKAIFVCSPPAYRGGTTPKTTLELTVLKLFPGVAMFIEKPVATGPVDDVLKVAAAVRKAGGVCSVGYMLRYLKAVQQIKYILEENNLQVMATTARYVAAYEGITKKVWWDKAVDCGPVVEQGTHFCDLSRYFGGDVDISTVTAHSLEFYEPAGTLSKMSFDEEEIKKENRIPRVTSATWKYENGAVGTMTHLVTLQGKNYACELEVYADGWMFKIIDPYNAPELRVRGPMDDVEQTFKYSDDDPFFSEMSSFIDSISRQEAESSAVEDDDPVILSSFEDACKSYELTWAIRNASEKTRKIPEGLFES